MVNLQLKCIAFIEMLCVIQKHTRCGALELGIVQYCINGGAKNRLVKALIKNEKITNYYTHVNFEFFL